MNVQTAPIAPETPLHPVDRGLQLRDWAEYDPDGYTAAVSSIFEDEWQHVLAEMVDLQSRNQPISISARVIEKMERKLWEEGNQRAAWVLDWEARFNDD